MDSPGAKACPVAAHVVDGLETGYEELVAPAIRGECSS